MWGSLAVTLNCDRTELLCVILNFHIVWKIDVSTALLKLSVSFNWKCWIWLRSSYNILGVSGKGALPFNISVEFSVMWTVWSKLKWPYYVHFQVTIAILCSKVMRFTSLFKKNTLLLLLPLLGPPTKSLVWSDWSAGPVYCDLSVCQKCHAPLISDGRFTWVAENTAVVMATLESHRASSTWRHL